MSEDRFARIEEKLDLLVAGQAGLQAGLATVETGQRALEMRQESLEAGQRALEVRLDKVEITQEAMRDDIKPIAEGHAVTQAALARGFAMLRDHFDRKIDLLSLVVQEHSAILAAHGLTLPPTQGQG